MWDATVQDYGLSMRAESIENLPVYELPQEYSWRFYQRGDDRAWARIWHSAGAFKTFEEALDCFRRDFPTDEHLPGRMIFLTDNGEPFATATAWFNEDDEGGRLHWVGIDDAHQGKGLSRPLISLAMQRLRELGYVSACLASRTPCWVAIRVYNKTFGFKPVLLENESTEAWKVVSERSGTDFVSML